MKSTLVFLFFFVQIFNVFSLNCTLSGYLRDATSGEELLYASV